MKCRYWDCGWCYAPENVKTNATQGGCFEPEYCPYTKQMTEQEHLECEIQEYQIELQRHEEAIERLKVRIEKKKKELLKKMKSFNINETVKIRLTKFGKELHKKEWEDFWGSRLDEFPYEPPKEDENGYCEFQMWQLMEKFGNHCGLCKELAFETVILIDEEDLK